MKRKLAIMQPYFFPYIGYFQLINSVDKFILFDDVAFIKQGWIHRNNIQVNGLTYRFTVPVSNRSSFEKINRTLVAQEPFRYWRNKFLKTLSISYGRAPYYPEVLELVNRVLRTNPKNIGELAAKSILAVSDYLGVKTPTIFSSVDHTDSLELKGVQRLFRILEKESASHYLNTFNGATLYREAEFREKGFTLKFLRSTFSFKGVPLSIIDTLMHHSAENVRSRLIEYEIHSGDLTSTEEVKREIVL